MHGILDKPDLHWLWISGGKSCGGWNIQSRVPVKSLTYSVHEVSSVTTVPACSKRISRTQHRLKVRVLLFIDYTRPLSEVGSTSKSQSKSGGKCYPQKWMTHNWFGNRTLLKSQYWKNRSRNNGVRSNQEEFGIQPQRTAYREGLHLNRRWPDAVHSMTTGTLLANKFILSGFNFQWKFSHMIRPNNSFPHLNHQNRIYSSVKQVQGDNWKLLFNWQTVSFSLFYENKIFLIHCFWVSVALQSNLLLNQITLNHLKPYSRAEQ